MLRDQDVTLLRQNERYRKITKSGSKDMVTDLVRTGKGDFKAEAPFWAKLAIKIVRARIIRKEVAAGGKKLLEKILNYELKMPREPESIEIVCNDNSSGNFWLRYDRIRVEALFNYCFNLLDDPEYRHLVKSHSHIGDDVKNSRMLEIKDELKFLLDQTLLSIDTKGIFDKIINTNARYYYKNNEPELQRKFIGAAFGGGLGALPMNQQIENVNPDASGPKDTPRQLPIPADNS